MAAGEHVALMGPSGSGKTAVLGLIAGLVPAERGEILIGVVPLPVVAFAAAKCGTASCLSRRP